MLPTAKSTVSILDPWTYIYRSMTRPLIPTARRVAEVCAELRALGSGTFASYTKAAIERSQSLCQSVPESVTDAV